MIIRIGYRLSLIVAFAIILLCMIVSQVLANDVNDVTASDILTLVDEFAEEGQFTSDSTARALKMHLMAVEHFQQQGETDKAVQHMNSFKILLGHQVDNDLMTENAFQALLESTDAWILRWDVLTIVENGEANAVVIIPSEADDIITAAAQTLVDYIEKSTGARLDMIAQDEWQEEQQHPVHIFIGFEGDESDPEIHDRLEGLSNDGFVIRPKGNQITIAGPTSIGTKFGVYDFLERFVGVMWLMPGEIGEDVPEHTTISIPKQMITDQPTFISRDVVGLLGYHWGDRGQEDIGKVQMEWLDHNRNHSSINFHHNLYNLFPPSEYLETHPEIYPQRDGEPYLPRDNAGWQIHFSNPFTVEEAIRNIVAYFNENPDQIAYSLGINDPCCGQNGFIEQVTEKNSIGQDHYSEIYYDWVNQVAEGVLKVHPDKYFGLLAYAGVYDPPSFPLNPRVIPIITDDRYSWNDPRREAEGKQVAENWLQYAENIAFYDYIYGTPYIVPRIFNEQMAENLRYAADSGAVGFFGEGYPNFGEGPKWWLTMKLLWNPHQDENELIQEWSRRAVGEQAAADLISYYDFWEKFWKTTALESDWYHNWYNSNPRHSFMPFNNASYAAEISVEDMEFARSLLESVVQKAETSKQKLRAEKLLRSFEYYEAAVLSYPITRVKNVPEDQQEALEFLDQLLQRQLKDPAALAEKAKTLIEEFETDPILVHIIRAPHDNQGFNWTGNEIIKFLTDWVKSVPESSPVLERLAEIFETEGSSQKGQLAEYLLDQRDVNNLPEELRDIPYNQIQDFDSDEIWTWSTGQGMSRVEDEDSLLGKALKISFDEMTMEDWKHHYVSTDTKPITIGVYDSSHNQSLAINHIKPSDITPDEYTLYKLAENIKMDTGDFAYVFFAQTVRILASQVDLDPYYDIYVSLKFEGAIQGGNPENPDAVYVDRIIFVEKDGPDVSHLPEELRNIPYEKIIDFESDRIWTWSTGQGMSRVDDEGSLLGKALKITLDDMTTEQWKHHYISTDASPILMGVYDAALNQTTVKTYIEPNDITPDEYTLFKLAENVKMNPGDFAFVFFTQTVRILASMVEENQLYDIYASLKFEGALQGGNPENPDAIYIDRMIFVEKDK